MIKVKGFHHESFIYIIRKFEKIYEILTPYVSDDKIWIYKQGGANLKNSRTMEYVN